MPSPIENALAPFAAYRGLDRLVAIESSRVVFQVTTSSTWVRLGSLLFEAAARAVTRESLDVLGRILASTSKWPALSASADGDHALVDPAVLECALAHDIELAPAKNPSRFRFWLQPWAARERLSLAEDALERVGAHRWLGASLVASLLPGGHKRVGAALDRATRAPGCAFVFAAIDARITDEAATATLDRFVPADSSSDRPPTELWLHAAARASIIARCPRFAPALREITPARLLRNSLREAGMTRVTDDDAKTLIELAVPPVREADTVMSYGTMQAVLVAPAAAPAAAPPALVAAIEALRGATSSVSTRAVARKASTRSTKAGSTKARSTKAGSTKAGSTKAGSIRHSSRKGDR